MTTTSQPAPHRPGLPLPPQAPLMHGPWADHPSFLERRWRGPAGPASAATIWSIAAAAAVAALSVPLDQAGIGWVVAAIAGVAALIIAGRKPRPSPLPPNPASPNPESPSPASHAPTSPSAASPAPTQPSPVPARLGETATTAAATVTPGGTATTAAQPALLGAGETVVDEASSAPPGVGDTATTAAGPAVPGVSEAVTAGAGPAVPGWGATSTAASGAPARAASTATARQSAAGPVPLVGWRAPSLDGSRFGWSAATVALLAVGGFRAADWLFMLCVGTAFLTGALAVAGGRSSKGIVRSVWAAPIAGFRSLPWILRGIKALRRGRDGVRLVATVAVSVALLVVFGALFASADAAFAGIVEAVVPDLRADSVVRWIFLFTVTVFALGGAAFLRAAPPDLSGLDTRSGRRVARLEWAIPLLLLVSLFALFVGVQLTVLFGGSEHVLATDGLTYAEYARGGFWQLLVVTGLTLLVLAGAARWASRRTTGDRVWIRALLGALAVLTLVIVGSALHRMNLYADTYGLTRLRILVALCEAWLGVVFLLILVAGIRMRAAWLPRAVIAVGVLALLGLAAADPDRVIAERNIAQFEQSHTIDTYYLSTLSADAVPALDGLPAGHRDCALRTLAPLLSEAQSWQEWNWSRENARDLLAADPPRPGTNCPGVWSGR
ncbi:DUF4153 domain-containing protein [Actinoplanes sp. NPDC051494]|uniref:DUF4153 domain-containing protein n=1 Tax=Actinoplanes sp. NPDC051494 TaxID=3363907 RepID=UPI00378D7B78